MTTDVQKEAYTKISNLIAQADANIAEAVRIAREAGVEFSWEGPAYGMGGYFDPARTEDEYGDESDGWLASSQSC